MMGRFIFVARTTLLFLLALFPLHASGQDCFDYSQAGTLYGIEPLIVSEQPSGFGPTFFWAHGQFATVYAYQPMPESLYHFYFLDLESETPAEPILSYFHFAGPYDTDPWYGDGPIASYLSVNWEADPTHRNVVRNLSDPAFPRGYLDRHGVTYICGETAYVNDDDAFWIFSLTDIENPVELGNLPLSGTVEDAVFDPRFATILYEDFTMEVWDIAQSASPSLLGSMSLPFFPSELSRGPDYAVLGCGEQGFYVVGLADPDNPLIPTSTVATADQVRTTLVRHPYVYLACGSAGIFVADLSDEVPVVLPGSIDAFGSKLSAGANRVFNFGGSQVIEVPLHCDNLTPARKNTLGGLRSMFR